MWQFAGSNAEWSRLRVTARDKVLRADGASVRLFARVGPLVRDNGALLDEPPCWMNRIRQFWDTRAEPGLSACENQLLRINADISRSITCGFRLVLPPLPPAWGTSSKRTASCRCGSARARKHCSCGRIEPHKKINASGSMQIYPTVSPGSPPGFAATTFKRELQTWDLPCSACTTTTTTTTTLESVLDFWGMGHIEHPYGLSPCACASARAGQQHSSCQTA